MENTKKNLPIEELIAQTDALMLRLGYKPSTMRHFRQAWNALKNLAKTRSETTLTTELGFALLREHYHVNPYDQNLSHYKSVVRRGVMLLLEYQVSGSIAKRIPKRDHAFPDGFKEIGEGYIGCLIAENHLKEGTIRNHRLALEAIFTFFEAHGVKCIADVNVILINDYLKTFAGCTKSYISGRLNALKRFFEYALSKGYISVVFSFPEVSVYKDCKIPEFYTDRKSTRLNSSH